MIKLMKSTFYNEKETKNKLCTFILNSNQLSMGDKCSEFENCFSKYQRRRYSVLYNSGSSANLALIQALLNLNIIKKGDAVGFSAVTWATNAMPLIQLGLKPVPIDVSLKTLNINSLNIIEILKKEDLKALFITNLLGFCSDLDKIAKICKDNKIILLEDNCESLGSELNSIKLGNFGLASTFSSFVGHHMSTIEGGIVCTDDKTLYNMLVMVRAHGWSRNIDNDEKNNLKKKYNINDFYDQYTFYYSAYNFRPTEITGFLGIEQLDYIQEINKKRNANFLDYEKAAVNNTDFQKLDIKHMNFVSNFAYPLIFKDRKKFETYRKKFEENSIEIRPIVGGSVLEQPFFKEFLNKNNLNYSCPNSKIIHEQGFYFPNNPELTNNEIKKICSLLKNG